ncbi:MAG: hypothetical protein ACJ8LM_16765 [Candidatus Udaeobacter sp.]
MRSKEDNVGGACVEGNVNFFNRVQHAGSLGKKGWDYMEGVFERASLVIAGLFFASGLAAPQAYTISAKPGAVNYTEGAAYLNSSPISEQSLKSTFLNANDTLSTDLGKAEVLLAPGIFVRLGDNSQIRMVSPSLADTQIEVNRGEVMIEASGLVKGSRLQVMDHGGSTIIEKNGLYRFTADDPPTVAVLDGKADVLFGDRKLGLKKGRQAVLAADLTAVKFDSKKDDELYAWSNVRSEYNAAASYRVSSSARNGLFAGSYGLNGVYSPGWFWDSAFSSWAWLPGAGAFYSPFGYGFYSPALVGYAPVITAPVYRGGHWGGGKWNHGGTPPAGWHGGRGGSIAGGGGVLAAVPVNPNTPAAVGSITASPWANRAARHQAMQSWAGSGLNTASGTPAPGFSGAGASARPDRSGGAWQGGAHAGGWQGGGHPGGWQGGAHPAGEWSGGAHTSSAGGQAGGGGGGHMGGGASGGGRPSGGGPRGH